MKKVNTLMLQLLNQQKKVLSQLRKSIKALGKIIKNMELVDKITLVLETTTVTGSMERKKERVL
mgnify:CR=1 FL=1